MRELDKVLNKNERVAWEGKPVFGPFFMQRVLFTTIIGLFFIVAGIFGIISMINLSTSFHPSLIALVIANLPLLIIGLVLIFVPITISILLYKRTYYALTDKRVIIQTGIVGRDFRIIDFDMIRNAEINVDSYDKIFGKKCGTIVLSASGIAYSGTGLNRYNLCNIPDPYNVFKGFKKLSHDIKTDIEFPNEYRPAKNTGYRTGYRPKRE